MKYIVYTVRRLDMPEGIIEMDTFRVCIIMVYLIWQQELD